MEPMPKLLIMLIVVLLSLVACRVPALYFADLPRFVNFAEVGELAVGRLGEGGA